VASASHLTGSRLQFWGHSSERKKLHAKECLRPKGRSHQIRRPNTRPRGLWAPTAPGRAATRNETRSVPPAAGAANRWLMRGASIITSLAQRSGRRAGVALMELVGLRQPDRPSASRLGWLLFPLLVPGQRWLGRVTTAEPLPALKPFVGRQVGHAAVGLDPLTGHGFPPDTQVV